jgi:putative hydrolase of the HAD superfamily
MERNKVILIDMYGVIIKESKGYFIPYTFQHFPEEEYDRLTNAFKVERVFSKAQKGLLSNEEFLGYLGYENPKETMEDYLKNFLTLDEQFPDFAEKMAGRMEMCLLSNDVLEWSEFLTEHHHMNPYFRDKIVSGEVHLRKPDKAIFECALERLQCGPEDCIFVDNSVKNLRVAEELGMTAILFNRDGEEYEGHVVNDFGELEEMLQKFR